MREALKVGVERTAADNASLPVAAPKEGRWRRQVRCPGWGGAAKARGYILAGTPAGEAAPPPRPLPEAQPAPLP